MSNRRSYSDFAALFKKYRLKSEIETLSEFGNLLAEEGYIYEDSLFTRWQNGQRIPKDRRVLLTIIELFAKKGGIKNIIEANRFLESVEQRDLNEEETAEVGEYFHVATQTLPPEIDVFVGREKIMQKVIWSLINKKKILLYGIPGVGKTAIGIRAGHLLQDKFSDGVFWFRSDIKQPETIVDETLRMLGVEDNILNSYEKKLKRLNKLLAYKSILLILDNLSIDEAKKNNIESIFSLNCSIFATSNWFLNSKKLDQFHLIHFTQSEYRDLAEKILGKPYVLSKSHEIDELGTMLGYIPILASLLLKQIFLHPNQLHEYIYQIRKNVLPLEKINYDDKTLIKSVEICLKILPEKIKKVLYSCTIFEGNDFDIRAVAYLNAIPISDAKKYLQQLIDYSFINLSIKDRYRMNPTMRMILLVKANTNELSSKLVAFYKEIYTGKILGEKVPFGSLSKEIDNIIGLIKLCFDLGMYEKVILLWQFIHIYLWLAGKWKTIISLDGILQKSFIYVNDLNGLGYYIVNDIGKIVFFQHHIKKARYFLMKALKIAEKSRDVSLKAYILQKYGALYASIGDYNNAKKSVLEAISLSSKTKNTLETITNNIYYGHVCLQMKNYIEADKTLRKTYLISKKKNIEDLMSMSAIYLGQLNLEIKKYKVSESFFKIALAIDKKLHRKLAIALEYEGLYRIAKIKGETVISKNLLKLALNIYEELGMKIKAKKLQYTENAFGEKGN